MITSWLKTLPGLFEGHSAAACIAKAYNASGLAGTMSADVFEKQLAMRGFTPLCVWPWRGTKPPLYRLNLPSDGPGVVGMR